jgi:hypothetical protein
VVKVSNLSSTPPKTPELLISLQSAAIITTLVLATAIDFELKGAMKMWFIDD